MRVLATFLVALISFSPLQANADNPNPSTSDIDNYVSLSGSSTAKQGIQSASTSTYMSGSNDFTIELWMMPAETMTSNTGSIFVKTDRSQFDLVNGVFHAWFNSNGWKGTINTGVKARIGEWQHVAFVKNGNLFSIYLNGSLAYELSDATNVPTTLSNTSTYTSIGSNPWSVAFSANQATPQLNFFAGGIDEVKVWSTVRNQAEIRTSMTTKISPSTSGLLGYWDFNGTSNTSMIYDRTGSFNFTVHGSPTFPDVKTVSTSAGQMTVTFPRTYLNANAGFKIPAGVTSLNALVVGGGGGGGFDGGGGGGGGGVFENSNLAVSPETYYQVLVGGGGAAANGYTGGALTCNGSHSLSVIGCNSAAGGTSKFGNASASGGGGGGGVEAAGGNDSESSATVRGGGGATGGQNNRSGINSAGAGAFSGGSVSTDSINYGGGGGGSSSEAGAIGQLAKAGNGAAGITASMNSTVYGAGGAGGSFYSSTAATGGSGGASGGTASLAPTSPTANRGGGGGGGGNGNTPGNAFGSHGAAGIIILKWALKGSASISYSGTPTYKSVTTLSATTNTPSKVTFLANNKRIPGCISIPTSANVATCNWKPALHGSIALSVQVAPNDSEYASTRISFNSVIAQKRTNKR